MLKYMTYILMAVGITLVLLPWTVQEWNNFFIARFTSRYYTWFVYGFVALYAFLFTLFQWKVLTILLLSVLLAIMGLMYFDFTDPKLWEIL